MNAKRLHGNKIITYRPYTLENFERIPQLGKLTARQQFEIAVAGHVFPFKTNNYVINELIDWNDPLNDPMFRLTFPRKELLSDADYNEMARALRGTLQGDVVATAHRIRSRLVGPVSDNREKNVATIEGIRPGLVQHRYKPVVVFFPAQAHTCYAYCTFCFRWPQFERETPAKGAPGEAIALARYIRQNPDVHEIVISGGDPLMMPSAVLAGYIGELLNEQPANLTSITITTKSLAFWPYRFTLDEDAPALLGLFRYIVHSGIRLTLMAHFTHPAELNTKAVLHAIEHIRATGAEITTQAPVLRNINDRPETWAALWQKQIDLGCSPQYLLAADPTALRQYYSLPLVKTWEIFNKAARKTGHTDIQGPIMHCAAGIVKIIGVGTGADRNIQLVFLKARNPDWEGKLFHAGYNNQAVWINELKPASGGEKFFFEDELENVFHESIRSGGWGGYE